MFIVKASYRGDIKIRSSIKNVREFFLETKNFAHLMPGVLQIHIDANGIAHWKVQVEVPAVGKLQQRFSVTLSENTDDRTEWSPLRNETGNLLRYSADFVEKGSITLVHFNQIVELRRKNARALHPLAALAGETLISSEMTKRITEMIRVFIEKAKDRLEE